MEAVPTNEDGTPANRPRRADMWAAISENMLQNVIALLSIIVGAIYINDCPIDHRIPIILIVLGSLSLGYCLLCIVRIGIWGVKAPGAKNSLFDLLTMPIALAALGAWIATIIFVFGVYSSVEYENEGSDNHCNSHLYRFAYWSILLPLIFWLIRFAYALCCKRTQ